MATMMVLQPAPKFLLREWLSGNDATIIAELARMRIINVGLRGMNQRNSNKLSFYNKYINKMVLVNQ